MTHKFRKACLVFAGLLAMGISGSSAASAAEFHTASAPTTITGTQTTTHVLTTSAGIAHCKTATFSGTLSVQTTTEITLTPTFQNCTAFNFISVPIDVNGCAFRFTASGTGEIECPAGKSIEITVPGCTTKIGPQHFASGLTFTTSGTTPNRDIISHVSLSGMSYNECGTPRTNGTYRGSTTWKGSAGEIWYA